MPDQIQPEVAVLLDFFEMLHALWHAHGCSEGRVTWSWSDDLKQAVVRVDANRTRATWLARRIHDLTVQWPLPCGACDFNLQRREMERRQKEAQP